MPRVDSKGVVAILVGLLDCEHRGDMAGQTLVEEFLEEEDRDPTLVVLHKVVEMVPSVAGAVQDLEAQERGIAEEDDEQVVLGEEVALHVASYHEAVDDLDQILYCQVVVLATMVADYQEQLVSSEEVVT